MNSNCRRPCSMIPVIGSPTPSLIFSPALVLFREIAGRESGRDDPHRRLIPLGCGRTQDAQDGGHHADRTRQRNRQTQVRATFAEAEMLAEAGTKDVCLAYNPVGPNVRSRGRVSSKFPRCRVHRHGDHPHASPPSVKVMEAAGRTIEVLLDLDVGLHRTGIARATRPSTLSADCHTAPACGPAAFTPTTARCISRRSASASSRSRPIGRPCRRFAIGSWPRDCRCRESSSAAHPRSRSMPPIAIRRSSLRPGTCVLNDAGYNESYRDMKFHAGGRAADAGDQPADAPIGSRSIWGRKRSPPIRRWAVDSSFPSCRRPSRSCTTKNTWCSKRPGRTNSSRATRCWRSPDTSVQPWPCTRTFT